MNKKIYILFPFLASSLFLGACTLSDLPNETSSIGNTESDLNKPSEDISLPINTPSDEKSDDKEHEHNFQEIVADEFLIEPATCTHPAVYASSCECGLINFDNTFVVGDKLKHDFSMNFVSDSTLARNATCISPASYYYSCRNCDAIDYKNTFQFGDVSEHDFTSQIANDSTLAIEATCISPASYYYSCINCDAIDYNNTFEFGEMNFDKHNKISDYIEREATCTAPEIHVEYCVDCSRVLNQYEYGEALNHFYDAIVDDSFLESDATCSKAPTYYFSCQFCGDINYNETFECGDVKQHEFIEKVSKEALISTATCLDPAKYYYTCKFCGELSNDFFDYGTTSSHIIVSDVNNDTLASPATCFEVAKYYYSCSFCYNILYDEDTFEYGSVLEHDHDLQNPTDEALYEEATCTTQAIYYYSCSKCNTVIKYYDSKFSHGDLKPHNFVMTHEHIKSYSTCTTPNIYYYSCENCSAIDYNHAFEDGLPMGHTYKIEDYHYKENVNDVDYVIKKCINCDNTINDELIIEENSSIYNFEYLVQNGYTYITKYKRFYNDERDNNIIIPTTYKGQNIFSIYFNAFSEANNVETITILASINAYEIFGPSSLKTVISDSFYYHFYNNASNFDPEYHIKDHNIRDSMIKGRVYYDYVETRENDEYEYALCFDSTSYYITLKKYKGNAIEVIIPDTIDGYPVKTIGSYTFANNDVIQTIITSNNTNLAFNNAIYNCNSLKHVYVKNLDYEASYGNPDFCELGFIEKGIYTDKGLDQFEYIIYTDGINSAIKITEIINLDWSMGGTYSSLQNITQIGDYTVNAIGKKAFSINYDNSNIITKDKFIYVCLPSTIEFIDDYAFQNCGWLTEIYAKSSLKRIGKYAFANCKELKKIGTTTSLVSIGDYAFSLCEKFEGLDTSSLKYVGESAFEFCRLLTKFDFVEGLVTINYHAFFNCKSLTSIYIPSTLEILGDGAFSSCYNLSSVTFAPDLKITSIPTYCFYECAIETFTFPKQITQIGHYAFYGCPIKAIVITKEITSIGNNPFAKCSNLEDIYVDPLNPVYTCYYSKVYNTNTNTFGINAIVNVNNNSIVSGCKNTLIISLINSLGADAFNFSLDYIYIPSNVTSFGKSSLEGVRRIYLESVNNPLTYSISSNCLNAITNVYSVGVTNDELIYSVFDVNGVLEATIDGSLRNINDIGSVDLTNRIKRDYSNLRLLDENVTLKGYVFNKDGEFYNVVAIRDGAFRGCVNLTHLTLSSEVYPFSYKYFYLRTIGNYAFSECSNLVYVRFLPKSLESIGEGAFYNCTNLKEVLCYVSFIDELNYQIGDKNECFINATFKPQN